MIICKERGQRRVPNPIQLDMNCHRHYHPVYLQGSSSSPPSSLRRYGCGDGYGYRVSVSSAFFVKPLPFSKPRPSPSPSHRSILASSRRPHQPGDSDHRRRRRSRQEEPPFGSSSPFNGGASPCPPVNHYETLGLTRPASPTDIKAAYRRLARQYHPDVNKDAGAVETFKSIRLAYEILSNETTRKAYDISLRLRFQEAQKGVESRTRRYGHSHGHNHRNEQLRKGVRNVYSANKNNANNSGYRPPGFYRDDYSLKRDWAFFDYQEGFFEPGNEYGRAWFRKEIWGLLFGTCIVTSIWYVLGAHTALTFFVFFIPHGELHSLEYWLASFIAWLIGAERGLALKFGLAVITSLFGEVYNKIIAILFLALWIGGDLKYVIPLPRGAVMAMTYLCIRRYFLSPYST